MIQGLVVSYWDLLFNRTVARLLNGSLILVILLIVINQLQYFSS